MKRTIILSMAGLVLLAACQKEISPVQQEKSGMTLSATVEQQTYGTKTALGSGNTVVWSDEDEVRVWNGDNTNTPFHLISGAGTTNGRFQGDEILNPQYAFYPSSAITKVEGSEATFTIPATQNYVANTFDNGANFAVAQISGNNMSFKNICGVLKLQLKGTTMVKSIVICGKANEKLNGTYKVDASLNTPNMACTTTEVESEKCITLDCGDGVLLDPTTAKNFYIVIPKGALSFGFIVTINDVFSGSENIVGKGNTIARNIIKTMPEKSINIKGNILPGSFSVSSNKKVRFATGNLRATIDASGSPTAWSFADHQYDIISGSSGAIIGESAGIVESFGVSSDGVGATSGYKAWGINASQTNTDYSGAFVDWATNTTVQSLLGNIWTTPTASEIGYIFTSRTSAAGQAPTIGEEENARWASARVNGISGVLVFPDSFNWNTSTMGNAPTVFNVFDATCNNVNYSVSQFEVMEKEGCVFLLGNGERKGAYPSINTISVFYQLNSNMGEALVIRGDAEVIGVYPGYIFCGRNVRFVTTVK